MKSTELTKESAGFTVRAAWLAAAKFVSLTMTFVLPLLLVRQLSQTEFGLYKLSFQILSTVVTLLLLQVGATAYYFMPREPEKKSQVALNILLFYLSVGAIVAAAFALFPAQITGALNIGSLSPHLPLIGLAILLWLLTSPFEIFMVADGEVRAASVVIVILQVFKTGLLLAAALLSGDIQTILLAAVAYGVLQLVILGIWLRRRFKGFGWAPDWRLLGAQLANALPFGFGGLVYTAQYELHNYFISYYFDPAHFAIYSVGCFQLLPLIVLMDSAETILIPEVARLEKAGDYPGIIRVWLKAVRQLSFFFLPSCVFLFVLREEFITALFTKQYALSVPIFAVSLANAILFANLCGAMMRAFGDFKYFRFRLCLMLLPLMWGGLYLGVRTMGMIGAMAAVVAVRVLDTAITSWHIGRRIGLSRRDLQYLSPVVKTAAASMIAGLATFLLKSQLANWPAAATLLSCSLAFSPVYLVSAFRLGAVTEDEKAKLRLLGAKFFRWGTARLKLSSATGF